METKIYSDYNDKNVLNCKYIKLLGEDVISLDNFNGNYIVLKIFIFISLKLTSVETLNVLV